MSKEVAKKPLDTSLKVSKEEQALLEGFGQEEISAQDIIIPRILLCQPVSDAVTNGDSAFGDFIDSLTNRKIGDFKTPFRFIPFACKKLFIEYDVSDEDEKKFLRVVPITPKNEKLPYQDFETTPEGKRIPVSRDYTLNFYGLLPEELETQAAGLPYILTFRRTSLKQGKKLYTQMFVTNRQSKLTPAGLTVTIAGKKETNDKSTYGVTEVLLDPANVSRTPIEHQKAALEWFKMVNAGEVKEDDREIKGAVSDIEVVLEPETAGAPGNF